MMKRLSMVFVAIALVATLACTGEALALEIRASGQMVFQFGLLDNYVQGGKKFSKAEGDHFWARHRMRPQIEFIASENIRGVFQFQFGIAHWGDEKAGTQLDTTSESFKTRQAYIDFKALDSRLQTRMGMQLFTTPHAVAGTSVMNAPVAGVLVSYAFTDSFSLGLFWARPYLNTDSAATDGLKDNAMDLFALMADLDFEEARLQPYFIYGRIGADSGIANKWKNTAPGANANPLGSDRAAGDRYSNLYLGALSAKVNAADNLTVNFDGIFSYLKNEASDTAGYLDRANGYFLTLGVDYGLEMGTLGGIAWYGSGNERDDYRRGKLGELVTISRNHSGFKPTRFGTSGTYAMGDGSMLTGTGAGTYGAGLHLKDFSLIENLSHTARAYHIGGTNDNDMYKEGQTRMVFGDGLVLLKKDRGLELNLDTRFDVYPGFMILLELGYIHMDWHKGAERGFDKSNVYNAQILFDYKF